VWPVGSAAGSFYLAFIMPANLAQFSDALAAHAAAARGAVAAIRLSETRHLTGTLWQPDVVVASEQSLPKRDEFELIVAGGSAVNAKLAGRDPGTNIAVLRLTSAVEAPTHRARLARRRAAAGRGAGCAARPGGPVERRDGDVHRRRRAGGQGGHRRGRHRPDGQRHAHAQPAQDRHASRLRQHRPQGGAARDPGRSGPFAAGHRRSAARRMSAVAAQRVAARRLRISIRTEDPALLAELRRIIAEAGHDVVDAPEEADVLMHDA